MTSYDRWYNVLKPLQGCLPTGGFAFAGVPLGQLAKSGWTNDSIAQQWQEKVAVSGKNFQGPLLVIVGENDVAPVDFVEQSVSASCRASGNQSLEMFTYQAMQHFPVIQASRPKWMSWIKEKIGGGNGNRVREGEGVCGKNSFVEGFNTNYTLQFVTPNWLVDWVSPPQEGWKLSL
jgi:hypothetical protein